MIRYGKLVTLGAFFALFCAACGSGVSESDAQARCDQEKAAKAGFFTQSSYDQCVSCQEDCGDDCRAQSTSPETYKCVDGSSP